MKLKFFFAVLVLQLAVAGASDQIQVKTSDFVAFEEGFRHAGPKLALNTRTGESLVVCSIVRVPQTGEKSSGNARIEPEYRLIRKQRFQNAENNNQANPAFPKAL